MSNGSPWLEKHDAILRAWAGRIRDKEIGTITGHCEITIRKRREAMGLPAYRGRRAWTRRDWLLNSAAGLDFQISDCRI